MDTEIKKLNLGCGKKIKEGWINVDIVKFSGVDKLVDLNSFPYPFKNDRFEYVLLESILEHLENPEKVMEEVWRITKRGGQTIITVPHFSCWAAWGDITHKRPFNSTSLFPFSIKKSHRSSKSLLNEKKELFEIRSKIMFGPVKRALGLQHLVNLNNVTKMIYEKNFAYIFPAESIVFKLKTIKP